MPRRPVWSTGGLRPTNLEDVEPPAPSPEMVDASRRHLTERYASGVDLLLWETEKRLIPDLDAIKSVTGAAASGQAEGLDMGAALVLVQAARLALDRLEGELFEAAHGMGMPSEAIAAIEPARALPRSSRGSILTARCRFRGCASGNTAMPTSL